MNGEAGPAAEEAELVLSELERSECMALLAQAGIGRVVLSVDCIPVAFPVNVWVVGDAVVFSTGPGTKFDAARSGDVLTVEADDVDRLYHTGWSVLVTGIAEVVTDPRAVPGADRLLTEAWLPGPHPHLVRVPATRVSGRRLAWATASHHTGSAPSEQVWVA